MCSLDCSTDFKMLVLDAVVVNALAACVGAIAGTAVFFMHREMHHGDLLQAAQRAINEDRFEDAHVSSGPLCRLLNKERRAGQAEERGREF